MPNSNLKEIEDYLKEEKDFNIKNTQFTSFIINYDSIYKEMFILDSKISNLNFKLKPYDLLDFLLSKSIPNKNLGCINKIMQDLKLINCENLNEEYSNKFKKVYNKVLKVGNEIVRDKIENKIESLYLNNDLITFIVLLDNKEEIMKEVIDKRREVCNKKIECYFDNVGEGEGRECKEGKGEGYRGEYKDERGKEGKDVGRGVDKVDEGKSEGYESDQEVDKTYDQDKDITHTFLSSFYFLLVNQEIYLWSLLFPNDLHIILKRLTSLELPLGYSKFERFVYAIFKVYFWEEKNLKGKLDKIYLKIKDKKGIECIKKMGNYVELKNVHEWVYNAFLYKSLKEYLSDGIIEI